eukprot:1223221-Karenia_brevis.AAC.1
MIVGIAEAVDPLYKAHQKILANQSKGPEATAAWWAGMAAGMWRDEVIALFSGLADWAKLLNLGFRNATNAQIFDVANYDNAESKECQDQIQYVWSMIVELACEHAWHMIAHETNMTLKNA